MGGWVRGEYSPRSDDGEGGCGGTCLLAEKLWNNAKSSIRKPCKVSIQSLCQETQACPIGRKGVRKDRESNRRERHRKRELAGRSAGHSPTHLGCAPQTVSARGH